MAPLKIALAPLGGTLLGAAKLGAALLAAAMLVSATAAPAVAQSSSQASNIAPSDTHSLIAPKLPLPPGGDGAPRRLMQDARSALARGQTGAAQEALERAETRLLDLGDPNAPASEQHAQLLQAVTDARQALGLHNPRRAQAILAAALGGVAEAGGAANPPPPPAPAPAPELAYPPQGGGWQWNGVRWTWVGGAYAAAPPAVSWVPAHWAWRNGWVWVPGHWRG